jgi:type II secretory pathway pseudopilin PulG
MNKKSQGYLLIEVCICIVLILILSTIAVPSLRFLNQQILNSDLEKLNMTFAFMQQDAVSSNKNETLIFNDNKSYSFLNYKEKLSNNIEFGLLPKIKGPPSSPNKVVTNPISFTNNKVIFYSNGQIQPGTVYLTDKFKEYQYALTVPISQVSFIRKYKNENGKWILL